MDLWVDLDGHRLEEGLTNGAVRLLDATWIIESHVEQNIISFRQALPEEAFLSYKAIAAATKKRGWFDGLRIIMLSYMWLHPDHPDPKGSTLRLLRKSLQNFIEYCAALEPDDTVWGVFWDFASLHQHPDPKNGAMRTDSEEQLFQKGLVALSRLYAHPQTFVFTVQELPEDYYPGAYCNDVLLPENTNTVEYPNRGWTFTELAMASLTKSYDKIMNISQFDKPGAESVMENCISNGQRQSPLFPDLFDKALKTKRFTNRKKDLRLLMRLYRDIFLEEFSQAEVLHYPGLHWDDSHLVPVFDIIRLGFTPKLQELDIGYNSLGLEGCSALARAILSAPELRTLVLDYNKINDDFFEFDNQKLCKAIAKLQVVSLNGNRISNKAVSCLVAAMTVHNNPPNLVEIRLRMTNVDDKDLLTKVIECCPSLRQLDLFGTSLENEIRCPGAVQEN